jgi:hypothetical protein
MRSTAEATLVLKTRAKKPVLHSCAVTFGGQGDTGGSGNTEIHGYGSYCVGVGVEGDVGVEVTARWRLALPESMGLQRSVMAC